MSQATDHERSSNEANYLGRLLIQAQRAYSLRAVEELRARGHHALSLTHLALLPHFDLDGTRISVLADRSGMTRQAAGQLVNDLEKGGYVVRASDPKDARATLVQFTEAGQRFLADATEVKDAVDAEFAVRLGTDEIETLRELLRRLVGSNSLAGVEES